MIWWLKVRRVHPVLTAAVGTFTLLTFAFRDNAVVLPSFSVNAGNSVVLSFFTPLIVVGAIGQCLDSRLPSAERTGLRPVGWMDTGLVLAAVGVVLAGSGAAGWALDSGAAVQAGRNTVLLTGMILLGRGFFGRASVVLPLAWVFAVVFFGRSSGTAYHSWALTGQEASDPYAAALAAATFVIGLSVNQYTSRTAL
ncbi:hypothetical protein [Streptomyces blattellae]|uniref:hypothetical protein n=1 Tax=Streptomyces blattellae TaxID=2569855 RepID=UPI001E54DEDA|nr:hypothetical protein [Streptomyces blattellae]